MTDRPESAENKPDPEDTGQISVAELLARNGQKSTGASSGGRRRRGVKGGISVAELTGEIPIVRAEPRSAEAPVISAAETKAPETRAPETRAPSKPPETTKEPELLSGSTTAAGDLLNRAHDESARRPYGSTDAQRPATSRPTPATGRRPSPGNESERPARSDGFVPRSRQRADAEPATDVTPKPTPENSRPKTQIQATSPVPPATQAFERAGTRPTPAEPKPAATPESATAERKTEMLDTSGESDTAKPVLSKAGAAVAERDDDATELVDVVDADADADADATADVAADEPAHTTGRKDAAKQWLVLAGQGVVAIIVGALLFKGFERLWDMLPWVALILAVLVIVGLVAVVRILRRTDDMISMVIAIAVGVFVTLGPLAFQLSTG
nr:hypothetical protein [Rhodococcus sp. (in: high G+C Gram-positive bacteria)]